MKLKILSKRIKGDTDSLIARNETGFVDIVSENLFLKQLVLIGGIAISVIAAGLVYAALFAHSPVFFVTPLGFARNLRSTERVPQEAREFARIAMRNLYEYEPWARDKREGMAKVLAGPGLLVSIQKENINSKAFRLFVTEEAKADEAKQGEIILTLTGIRIEGTLDDPLPERSRVRITLKISRSQREANNPYGFKVHDISQELL
ncbi:hypothetical protein ACFL6Y_05680 [Elusimicrobiota bacterium]